MKLRIKSATLTVLSTILLSSSMVASVGATNYDSDGLPIADDPIIRNGTEKQSDVELSTMQAVLSVAISILIGVGLGYLLFGKNKIQTNLKKK